MDDPIEELNEPGPWGGRLLTLLQEAGIVPSYAQHVIIDIPMDGFVQIHTVHSHKDGDKVLEIIPSLVKGAEIIEH